MQPGSHNTAPPVKPRSVALGITGGIAAYKAAELARLLTTRGFRVFPIMTDWATKFVGPLTFESLTGNPVRLETPGQNQDSGIDHIALIRAVDLLLTAPLTANTLAKMATGQADNFLTSTYLAHRGTTMVCPAMNTAMLEHPATRRNLKTLAEDGVHICHGEAGDLACGEVGAGRMAEPEVIVEWVDCLTSPKIPSLIGKKVLVSAGPTQEDLDPVRYITNRSSGKMGIAIARAFRNAGADVTLVCGPSRERLPVLMEVVQVRDAETMAEAILSRAPQADIVIMSAAVADYRPAKSDQKLKKSNFDGVLRLERTTDILATLGKVKADGQILVGFAAETQDIQANALKKLKNKNLDFIFANDVSATGLGFAGDQNRLVAYDKHGERGDLGTMSKDRLAEKMVALITADS